tara:strand:- start:582 stop:1811 length:1230 start_codon:yes stop_codon:yes gene_type:complete
LIKRETTQNFKINGSQLRWAVLAGVWLAYYCFGLTIVSLAPLVAEISTDLGLTRSQMGVVLGAWQLVYIGSAIPLGFLLDRTGARRGLMFAFIMIAVSVVLRSQADGYGSLFLAVAVFGLGGPLVSVGAPKTISFWFEGRGRGMAMGIYMTAPALGSMTGLSLTNGFFMPLMDGDWRAVILLYAGFIVASSLVWWLITAHPGYKLEEYQYTPDPSGSRKKNFQRLLRIPAFQIVLAMSVGIFFCNHGMNNWLPEILRSKGMDATTAGYMASIPIVFTVLSSLAIPRLAVPKRRVWILGLLFIGFGVSSIMLQANDSLWLTLALIAQGIARGSAMTLSILILLDIPGVGSERAGVAGGMFFSAAEIGGVGGPVLIGVVSDLSGDFSASLYMLTGMSVALIFLLLALRKWQ